MRTRNLNNELWELTEEVWYGSFFSTTQERKLLGKTFKKIMNIVYFPMDREKECATNHGCLNLQTIKIDYFSMSLTIFP